VVISLAYTLFDRMQAASLAMQALRDATSTDVARCASQAALDVLVGRTGRHSSTTSYSPGTLPSDRPQLFDPGVALGAYESTPSDRVKSLLAEAFLGDVAKWRGSPSGRWDEIDQAADRGPSAIADLDGRLLRLVARAVFAQKSNNLSEVNAVGEAGVRDANAGMDTARAVVEALCAGITDPRC
jgi:hypothetical protein